MKSYVTFEPKLPFTYTSVCSHMDFVLSAAKLFAHTMGVSPSEINTNPDHILQILKTVNVPEFKPKSKVRISGSDIADSFISAD